MVFWKSPHYPSLGLYLSTFFISAAILLHLECKLKLEEKNVTICEPFWFSKLKFRFSSCRDKIKSFQYLKGWRNLCCSAPSEQCPWDCFFVSVVFFLVKERKRNHKIQFWGGTGIKKYAVQVDKYNCMARLGQHSLLFSNTTFSKQYWAFIFFLVPLLESLILYFTRTSA